MRLSNDYWLTFPLSLHNHIHTTFAGNICSISSYWATNIIITTDSTFIFKTLSGRRHSRKNCVTAVDRREASTRILLFGFRDFSRFLCLLIQKNLFMPRNTDRVEFGIFRETSAASVFSVRLPDRTRTSQLVGNIDYDFMHSTWINNVCSEQDIPQYSHSSFVPLNAELLHLIAPLSTFPCGCGREKIRQIIWSRRRLAQPLSESNTFKIAILAGFPSPLSKSWLHYRLEWAPVTDHSN